MATNAILTFHDGKLDVPQELQRDLGLVNGASFHVVYAASGKLMLDSCEPADQPKADWRRLQGILAGSGTNPNAELEAEKRRELESDWKP